ncbi:MAG: transposase, partial [Bacteroidota bacterium]|nr:transposase [Bacteroidota bacterium]
MEYFGIQLKGYIVSAFTVGTQLFVRPLLLCLLCEEGDFTKGLAPKELCVYSKIEKIDHRLRRSPVFYDACNLRDSKSFVMAGTFSQIYLQFVFAVQGRQSLIPKEHKEELHKYITALAQARKAKMLAVHCMP